MPVCNGCGGPFEWGWDEHSGRWILLEPVEIHDDLVRSFVDAEGTLRADHRDRHNGGKPVTNVSRLAAQVAPLEAQAREAETRRAGTNRKRRERRAATA